MSDVPGTGEGHNESANDPLHFDTPEEKEAFLARLLDEVRAHEDQHGIGSYEFADGAEALFDEALAETDPDAAEFRDLIVEAFSPREESTDSPTLDRVFPEGEQESGEEEVIDAGLWTVPNAITAARMALTGPLVRRLEADPAKWGPTAIATAVSDNLDGFIARRFGQTSEIGRIMDPLADIYLSTRMALALDRANVVPRPLVVAALGQKAAKSAVITGATVQLGGAQTEVTRLGKYSEFVTNAGYAGFMLSERVQDPARRTVARAASAATMVTGIAMGVGSVLKYNEQRKELVRGKRLGEVHDFVATMTSEDDPLTDTRFDEETGVISRSTTLEISGPESVQLTRFESADDEHNSSDTVGQINITDWERDETYGFRLHVGGEISYIEQDSDEVTDTPRMISDSDLKVLGSLLKSHEQTMYE